MTPRPQDSLRKGEINESDFLSNCIAIGRDAHPCPKCLGPMVLTHIKPSQIGYESRTFQGVNCDHVDKVITATEAMKWMSSGLRAPV